MSAMFASSRSGPSWRPTTAHGLRQVAASRRPGHDLASVGMALHHFTDIVSLDADLSIVELHQATGWLTKQIRSAMSSPAPLEVLRELVTDPHRVATAGGRTATQLCGRAWSDAAEVIAERADDAVDGARSYGTSTMTQLASIHASHAHQPWWGTDAWDQRVDQWVRDQRTSPLLHAALRRAPERLDGTIIAAVLGQ